MKLKPDPGKYQPVGNAPADRGWRTVWIWLAALAAALFLAGFVVIARETQPGGPLSGLDGRLVESILAFRSPLRSRVFWGATLLGNTPFISAYLSAGVVALAAWGRWGAGVMVAVGTGLGQVVSAVAKTVVGRPRPPASLALIAGPSSDSLPSGHAFTTLVVAGIFVFLLWKWTGKEWRRKECAPGFAARYGRWVRIGGIVVATAGVVVVGVSRPYLGVHWASDVAAGWCLAAVWLIVVLGISHRFGWVSWPANASRFRLGIRLRFALLAVLVAISFVGLFLAARGDPLVSAVSVYAPLMSG
ncbi:MAG: phosphatase PAP2 family protein [Actinobacteria bacterium]|nr:phosphatase PAP2 family protein [Actinomycetota bacterium]